MKLSTIAWICYAIILLLAGTYYAYALMKGDQSAYLPGSTTDGHYQMELACSACHKEAFNGQESLQQACMDCHGQELKRIDDSHPKSKFTDPRNADRVAILDARYCVTCHREHRRAMTRNMGVTLPDDFCFYCHKDIAEDRPSHRDLPFDGCAAAGCHNFHDNKALYEDFIAKHLDEPATRVEPHNPLRNFGAFYTKKHKTTALKAVDADAEADHSSPGVVDQWASTAHAEGGVNCSGCHRLQNRWVERPAASVCEQCHDTQLKGFSAGRHGMRLATLKEKMQPALARRSMDPQTGDKELDCNACHKAHRYDTDFAAVEACLNCHNDEHSLAYKKSDHYRLWLKEINGGGEGVGVSCATCHLPRKQHRRRVDGEDMQVIFVEHNQNDNLRPNEKMVRTVCMNCHGLGFTLNALADEKLVQNNFYGQVKRELKTMDWVRRRLKEGKHKDKDKQANSNEAAASE